ncbi:unnamed protein product, partial [Caenorhabditis auriculariae]
DNAEPATAKSNEQTSKTEASKPHGEELLPAQQFSSTSPEEEDTQPIVDTPSSPLSNRQFDTEAFEFQDLGVVSVPFHHVHKASTRDLTVASLRLSRDDAKVREALERIANLDFVHAIALGIGGAKVDNFDFLMLVECGAPTKQHRIEAMLTGLEVNNLQIRPIDEQKHLDFVWNNLNAIERFSAGYVVVHGRMVNVDDGEYGEISVYEPPGGTRCLGPGRFDGVRKIDCQERKTIFSQCYEKAKRLDLRVYLVEGKPGSGKSHFTRCTWREDTYFGTSSKFLEGYVTQKTIVLDELCYRSREGMSGADLLLLTGEGVAMGNIKYGVFSCFENVVVSTVAP